MKLRPIVQSFQKLAFSHLVAIGVAVFTLPHLAMAQPDLHGNATSLGGGCYRLTNASSSQRGAVWYFGTVDVSQSWEMTADVYLGTNDGGADGMVFVLRDPEAPTLGGLGGLMGYGGVFPDEENPLSSARHEFQGHVHMIR